MDPRLTAVPAPVRAWVSTLVDERVEGLSLVDRTVPLGEAQIWAVVRGGATIAWLKRHHTRDKARRERHAYEAWVSRIPWGSAPWLGTCPEAPQWQLTGAAPGHRADRASLSVPARSELFLQLGRFLGALHALPCEDADPVPVDVALRKRFDGWIGRAQGIVEDELLCSVEAIARAPLPRMPRVPAHRDLGLHNVLVDEREEEVVVTVIDFGQSRPDVWMIDLVKLWARSSEAVAEDVEPFFRGYGRRLVAEEGRVLGILRCLHGLATWVWAAGQGDPVGVRIGRRVLEEALVLLE